MSFFQGSGKISSIATFSCRDWTTVTTRGVHVRVCNCLCWWVWGSRPVRAVRCRWDNKFSDWAIQCRFVVSPGLERKLEWLDRKSVVTVVIAQWSSKALLTQFRFFGQVPSGNFIDSSFGIKFQFDSRFQRHSFGIPLAICQGLKVS